MRLAVFVGDMSESGKLQNDGIEDVVIAKKGECLWFRFCRKAEIKSDALALIRTGQEFGPFPANPQDSFVESNYIEFITPGERYIALEWMEFPDAANGYPVGEALYVVVDTQPPQLLLEGVVRQDDPDVPGDYIRPFRLEYKLGRNLYRATIDLMLVPDDNMSTELDSDDGQVIRLVASAMPRLVAY